MNVQQLIVELLDMPRDAKVKFLAEGEAFDVTSVIPEDEDESVIFLKSRDLE